MNGNVVKIGMDLGTSKTAIIASTGKRATFVSAVGWPKDRFARSTLGVDVLFGEDAFKNRLAVRLVRPFAKGGLKYSDPEESGVAPEVIEEQKRAARLLIEHAISLINAPKGAKLHGVIGAPSRASVKSHRALIEAAESVFDTVVIVPEPFAVAYGVDAMQNTMVVDIGAGTIDICAMTGAYPTEDDQVTVAIGGDAVDEEFHRLLLEVYPEVELSLNMARDIKERHGFVHDSRDPVIVHLPVGSRRREFDVTEPLRLACQIIVEPLLDGVKQVLMRVDPEFRASMLNKILLSGGGSQIKGLDRAVEAAFEIMPDVRAEKVYDTMFAGAVGAYKLACAIPRDQWELVHRVSQEEQAQEERAEEKHVENKLAAA